MHLFNAVIIGLEEQGSFYTTTVDKERVAHTPQLLCPLAFTLENAKGAAHGRQKVGGRRGKTGENGPVLTKTSQLLDVFQSCFSCNHHHHRRRPSRFAKSHCIAVSFPN